jgi:hypothetical protein
MRLNLAMDQRVVAPMDSVGDSIQIAIVSVFPLTLLPTTLLNLRDYYAQRDFFGLHRNISYLYFSTGMGRTGE